MAFCKYCGTNIAEGEICSCQQSTTQTVGQPVMTQEIQTNAAQGTAPAQINITIDKEKASQLSRSLFADILSILKSPVDGAKNFVRSGNIVNSSIIIGLQSILTALIFTIMASKIGFVSAAKIKLVSTGKIFFLSLLIALVCGFGYSALLFLVDAIIFKGNSKFANTNCVSAVNSLWATPFIIIALLAGLMSSFSFSTNVVSMLTPVIVPLVFAFVGSFVGKFSAYKSLSGGTTNSEDKQFFVFIIVWLVMTIIVGLLANSVISSVIQDVIKQVASGMLDNLGDIFGGGLGDIMDYIF